LRVASVRSLLLPRKLSPRAPDLGFARQGFNTKSGPIITLSGIFGRLRRDQAPPETTAL
jgi:hypothetical protein